MTVMSAGPQTSSPSLQISRMVHVLWETTESYTWQTLISLRRYGNYWNSSGDSSIHLHSSYHNVLLLDLPRSYPPNLCIFCAPPPELYTCMHATHHNLLDFTTLMMIMHDLYKWVHVHSSLF